MVIYNSYIQRKVMDHSQHILQSDNFCQLFRKIIIKKISQNYLLCVPNNNKPAIAKNKKNIVSIKFASNFSSHVIE